MGATFNPALPTQLDRARFALGDKHNNSVAGEVAEPLLQDETIQAMIDRFGYREGVAQLADGLVAEYAQMPDSITDDTTKMQWSSRLDAWRELASSMRSGVVATGSTKVARKPAVVQQTTVQANLTSPGYSDFRSD